MSSFQAQAKTGLLLGVNKGWSSFLWIAKIVLPVSFLVALLQWTGWLNQLDIILRPLTLLLNLPPEAALPILTGMLLNLYAVIAIITVLPFTTAQMTLIAIFNLMAHGLIMEGIIQHRSGLNIIKATLVRIGLAVITVLIVSRFFGNTSQDITMPIAFTARPLIVKALLDWLEGTGILLLKIFGIIMSIMILLEIMRTRGWLESLFRWTKPLMKILGLSERTATMWVAANLFGLLYGGAVITEEAKKEGLTKEELERLHISIGSNHSMVEDPALFAVLGLNAFWLWVPRLIMVILAAHAYQGFNYLKKRLFGHI